MSRNPEPQKAPSQCVYRLLCSVHFWFCILQEGGKEMAERETERWRDRERETEKEVGF